MQSREPRHLFDRTVWRLPVCSLPKKDLCLCVSFWFCLLRVKDDQGTWINSPPPPVLFEPLDQLINQFCRQLNIVSFLRTLWIEKWSRKEKTADPSTSGCHFVLWSKVEYLPHPDLLLNDQVKCSPVEISDSGCPGQMDKCSLVTLQSVNSTARQRPKSTRLSAFQSLKTIAWHFITKTE